MPTPIPSRLLRSLAVPCLGLGCTFPLHAQEALQQTGGTAPGEIKVQARKNPGNLKYAWAFDAQGYLQSLLPAEPRMLDVMFRVSFTEMSIPEQDAYEARGWGVSVVGDSVDEAVPVRRGGYFLLPDLPQAYREKAALMFKEQSRRGILNVSWLVRIGPDQRLSYADFGRAIDEMQGVQKRIPIYKISLITEKFYKQDGIKACFLAPGGSVLIDGLPAADAVVGNCSVLKFDPARAGRGQFIEFKGPLDVVSVVETRLYLGRKDA